MVVMRAINEYETFVFFFFPFGNFDKQKTCQPPYCRPFEILKYMQTCLNAFKCKMEKGSSSSSRRRKR